MASQDSKEMQEPSSAGFGLLRTEMLQRVKNIRQVISPDSPLLPKIAMVTWSSIISGLCQRYVEMRAQPRRVPE